MPDSPRARRLAKRIAQVVASALEHEIKDPRLSRVTITDARITADLHDATVYYTVLPKRLDTEPDTVGAAVALQKVTGVLRSKVGAATGVRFTPTLTFVADTVAEDAKHIEDLLADAAAADAEVARQATTARPAGDANPYRAPRESDEPSDVE